MVIKAKLAPPLTSMFFKKTWWLEWSWYRSTKESMLANYSEIWLMIFQCGYKGQSFATSHDGLNNLGRCPPMDHCCRIIWKSDHWLMTKFGRDFYMVIRVKLGPMPWWPCFAIHDGPGSQMLCTKFHVNQSIDSKHEAFWRFLPNMGPATILVMWPEFFEQLWKRTIQRSFLPSLVWIHPVV